MPLNIKVGDTIQTKKKHPCGGDRWLVLRTGADFVIKCEKCNHQTWISRVKLEKSVKEIIVKE
ncbi:MAG: DUF951 domain-containing protein [Eubacteriales bacterium]|jgi:hypothetical protein|nr:DUF951 domain-containing protein [Eubacteriales bacterium]NCC81653.1 DUF951 domain-containing protein [Clostridia bacterium]